MRAHQWSEPVAGHHCPAQPCSVRSSDGGLCPQHTNALRDALQRLAPALEELDVTRMNLRSNFFASQGRVRGTRPPTLGMNPAAADAVRQIVGLVAAWLDAVTGQVAGEAVFERPLAAVTVLRGSLDRLRVHSAAPDALQELLDAVLTAERVIDRLPGRVEVGVCDDCSERLRARPWQHETICDGCGRQYDVDERRANLLAVAADRLVTGLEAASVITAWAGKRLSANRISQWKQKGWLVPQGQTPDGHHRPLYRLGDVAEVHLNRKPGIVSAAEAVVANL